MAVFTGELELPLLVLVSLAVAHGLPSGVTVGAVQPSCVVNIARLRGEHPPIQQDAHPLAGLRWREAGLAPAAVIQGDAP